MPPRLMRWKYGRSDSTCAASITSLTTQTPSGGSPPFNTDRTSKTAERRGPTAVRQTARRVPSSASTSARTPIGCDGSSSSSRQWKETTRVSTSRPRNPTNAGMYMRAGNGSALAPNLRMKRSGIVGFG
jgi:hypothetical protein